MSLVNKKSVYDRQTKGVEGANVGVTNPSDGNYHTIEGASDSPFLSRGGDHMVALLTKDVLSENSGITHLHSPNQSDFQDLDAIDGGNGYFHGVANPGKLQGKQLGGKDLHEAMLTQAYTNNGITVGPSPGPSGHSEFQDLDKILPTTNSSLGQFGGPYKNGVGPSDGYY